MNETIGIRLPDGQTLTRYMPVKYTEDDIDVAVRLAKNVPTGSVITVDGTRFKVVTQDPPQVEELRKGKASKPEPPAEESPKSEKQQTIAAIPVQVGQRWVTKDSRRRQEPFEVIQIDENALITDKGVRIQLHRLNRYKLVGGGV